MRWEVVGQTSDHRRDPEKNQSYTVTPQDEVVLDASTTAVSNTGRRTYTVAGLATAGRYDIRLLPAENVNDADGNISFDSTAAVTPGSGVSIESVNGTAVEVATTGNGTTQVNNVAPTADGAITFNIDSAVADEVVPVVWLDAESTGDNQLDVDRNGVPTEEFGIGGQTNWAPAEAANGAGTVSVTSVNRGLDYFTAGGFTYYYDSNDTYRIRGAANLTQAQFENLLTATDSVAVVYDRDAADTSVFEVVTDDVPGATNARVQVANNTATVTWTASTQPDAVYDVYLDQDNDAARDSATPIARNVTGTQYVINNLGGTSDTPQDYEVYIDTKGGVSGTNSDDAEARAAFRNPPVDAAPTTVANGVFAESASAATASAGDVWVLTFTENVTVAADASLLVDATVVENGVNATFAANGSRVTVTLTDDIAGITYPGDITAASGFRDSANQVGTVVPVATGPSRTMVPRSSKALARSFPRPRSSLSSTKRSSPLP